MAGLCPSANFSKSKECIHGTIMPSQTKRQMIDRFYLRGCSGTRTIASLHLELEAYLRMQMGTPEFYVEGHAPYAHLESWLESAESLPRTPRHVCEVGFNAGHSAIAWLCAIPNATLTSFDIGHERYTEHARKFVRQLFGDRFIFVRGNSTITLRSSAMHRMKRSSSCDVVSIDGGHDFETAKADILHLSALVSHSHKLIMDDLRCPAAHCVGPTRAWDWSRQQGLVESDGCSIVGPNVGACTGRFMTHTRITRSLTRR